MASMRHVGRLLALLTVGLLLLPGAAAASDDAPAAKAPIGRVLDVVRDLGAVGAEAGASAASATATGAASAASGTASFLDILADGAVAGGRAVVAAASAVGRGLVAVASAAADLLVLAGAALAAAARGAASLAVEGARALGALLVAAGSLVARLAASLAALLGAGARWVAEHPRESLYTTAAVGGTAATGGLLWWLRRIGAFAPLAGLYTRIANGQILDNGVRAKVFEEVRANPGIHPSALKEKLGLGWGTVVYHLDRLEESGLVAARKGSGQKCYFVNGGGLAPAAQKAAAALKHPSARAIAEYVKATPVAAQKEVGERLGMSPALVSWHVKRLVAAGILAQERTSRGVLLRVAAPEAALAA